MATKELTEGNPLKVITLFMLPMFIGNVFQQLYNFVDALVVGRYVGIEGLGAVGATMPMVFLIISFIFASTQGFSVVAAQKFGARDYQSLKKSAASSFILSGVITIVMTLISTPFTKQMLLIMNTPSDILPFAESYLFIMFGGIFATVYYNVASNLIRAVGDSKTPLFFLIISSFFNIFLDILFVKEFNWGIEGAAYATVAAQALSTVFCLIYMFIKFPVLRLKKEDWKVEPSFLYEHIKIGIPMGIQMSVLTIGILIVQYVLNGFGSIAVAAFTTAVRVDQIFSQSFIALGASIATFTAQNFGAGKISRIRKGARAGLIIIAIICVFCFVVLKLFGSSIMSMFMNEPNEEIIRLGIIYLNIIVVYFVFLGLVLMYKNILQGMGNSIVPLLSGVAELVARGVAALMLGKYLGYLGVCYATPLAWIVGMAVLYIGYKTDLKGKKSSLRLLKKS